MKFTLEIELGNEAMQSLEDVFDAIAAHGDTNPTPCEGYESGCIFDRNGNRVGKWMVTTGDPFTAEDRIRIGNTPEPEEDGDDD